MNNYEIIFESENILYIKINESLINDYLIMVNDPEVQKGISRKAKIYTYEQELEWVKEKLNEDATIFSMIENEIPKVIEILPHQLLYNIFSGYLPFRTLKFYLPLQIRH